MEVLLVGYLRRHHTGLPPTYFWYGKNDVSLKTLGYPFQGPAVRKALEANGVPCEVHVYENAPHAIGTGNGTDAEAG